MITLLKLSAYTGDRVAPSPNYDTRKASAIEGIVLHATADEGQEARSLSWLRSPQSRASCHLLVGRSGRVTRLVGDRHRAWHAGLSSWRGTNDVNSITLGIEIANRNDGESYTEAQYRQVAEIVAHYCSQGLSLDDVVSHGEIAGGRKMDPRGWKWDRFRTLVQLQLQAPNVPRPSILPSRAPAVTPVAPPKQRVPAIITTPKPVLRSRTLWLNALTVLAAAGVMLGDTLNLAFSVGFALPEEITMWALFGVGVVNIVLRFYTSCPLDCSCSEGADGSPPEGMIRVPRRAPGHDPAVVAARPR